MPVPAAAPVAPRPLRSQSPPIRSPSRQFRRSRKSPPPSPPSTGKADQIRGAGGFEAESDRGARHLADMQQKYPSLLASYRPMVQKADLGTKGVWYRLRIGPIVDKTAATKLCGQLSRKVTPIAW